MECIWGVDEGGDNQNLIKELGAHKSPLIRFPFSIFFIKVWCGRTLREKKWWLIEKSSFLFTISPCILEVLGRVLNLIWLTWLPGCSLTIQNFDLDRTRQARRLHLAATVAVDVCMKPERCCWCWYRYGRLFLILFLWSTDCQIVDLHRRGTYWAPV